MTMKTLILPHSQYKDSFLNMAKSLEAEGHWWGPSIQKIEQDFESYLQKLEDMKHGLNLESNQASGTEFWILHEGQVAGRLKVNDELKDWMKIRGGHIGYGIAASFRNLGLATTALSEALQFAKDKGMKEILMTCDDDNLGSIRVIEKNGGIFKDKVLAEGRDIYTRRFTINLI
jgi:predicted acetyltransferase